MTRPHIVGFRNLTYGALEDAENSFPIGFNFSGMIHRDERRFRMSDKDGDKELDRDEFSAFVHPEVKLEKEEESLRQKAAQCTVHSAQMQKSKWTTMDSIDMRKHMNSIDMHKHMDSIDMRKHMDSMDMRKQLADMQEIITCYKF